MKDSDFKSAQRSYDNLLPEPEGKFVCRQCSERVCESDRAHTKSDICVWCDDENSLKEFVKVMNEQSTMKELK